MKNYFYQGVQKAKTVNKKSSAVVERPFLYQMNHIKLIFCITQLIRARLVGYQLFKSL